jgi:type I restriction enzyme S subunit
MTSNVKQVSLGEVCEIVSSKRIFASEYKNEGIPFYRGKEISQLARGEETTVELFISQEAYQGALSRTGPVNPGDILLTAVGTLGNPYQVQEMDSPFYFKDGNVLWLRKFSDELNSTFLYYWLASDHGRTKVLDTAIGSTQAALTISALNKVEISLPKLGEQSVIVETLTLLDQKIRLNKAISKTLEGLAQTLFKSWFVDFDPVKAKIAGEKLLGMDDETASLFPDSMDETQLGAVPNGWEISTVERFCPFVYGKSLPARVRVAGHFPVYGSNGIVGSHNAPLVSRPTVVIGRKGTVGTVHLEMSPSWIIDTAFYTNLENDDEVFLAYLSLKRLGLDSMNSDAAVPGLNRDNAHRLPMTIATPLVREEFSRIVKPIFELNHHILIQNSVLSHVRDLLLPKLISGQLQIPEEMLAS